LGAHFTDIPLLKKYLEKSKQHDALHWMDEMLMMFFHVNFFFKSSVAKYSKNIFK
jgi:hypothetical protein